MSSVSHDPFTLLLALLQRAQAERDNAAVALRQADALVAQADAQAQALHSYRGDYDQRWTAHFQRSGTPVLLQCQRGFGQRLDQAITHQQANAGHLARRVQQARGLLLLREQRVAAVQKLVQRRQAGLQASANRREQRHTDEAAQRASSAANANHAHAGHTTHADQHGHHALADPAC